MLKSSTNRLISLAEIPESLFWPYIKKVTDSVFILDNIWLPKTFWMTDYIRHSAFFPDRKWGGYRVGYVAVWAKTVYCYEVCNANLDEVA